MDQQQKRLELQNILTNVLGSSNVYFQPPSTIKMSYPCIVYHLEAFSATNANNSTYKLKRRYKVTYIDRNPDSDVPLLLENLPYSNMVSTFITEGLNHYIFTLYH